MQEAWLWSLGQEDPLEKETATHFNTWTEEPRELQSIGSQKNWAWHGVQSWVFFGRNDAKAETPVLWPPHAKSWLIGKDSDAGRDWRQGEKGTTEDEMAGWHHQLNGREFEWTQGVGDGQGGLACCDSWGHKELDTTERLNWWLNNNKSCYWWWPLTCEWFNFIFMRLNNIFNISTLTHWYAFLSIRQKVELKPTCDNWV